MPYSTKLSILLFLLIHSVNVSFAQTKNYFNLETTVNYHEKLYSRLNSKDYGFAKFGESCEISSIEDYEDHIDFGYSILRDQHEDGKYRRVVEEHLRPKLRTFFYRSKTLCDFRKFLICSTGKCQCMDSSMGIGRNEMCRVHIGKRCDYTENQLRHFGIPKIPTDPVEIYCMGHSECAASFGASTKLCKCKQGYYGKSCKSSLTRTRGKFTQSGGGNATTISRDFWENEDFFLYPEEIKKELVHFMNTKNVYEPGAREREGEMIYKEMESDRNKEEIVVYDIFLRRLASNGTYDQPCDPEKQLLLDNPPLAKEGSVWVDPKPKEIKKWQLSLIIDDKPVCDFIQYLRCDENATACRCREGLVLEFGRCKLPKGAKCGSDYESVFEFDPLDDKNRFIQPSSPPCVFGMECLRRPFFYFKQCWCSEPGNSEECPEDLELSKQLVLNLGDKCDPVQHLKLFYPGEHESINSTRRLQELEGLKGLKEKFCNPALLLNCSESTSKCVCYSQLVEQKGICRAKALDPCEAHFFSSNLHPNYKVSQVQGAFGLKIQPHCVSNSSCKGGRCTCRNGMGGPYCNIQRSVFASIISRSKVRDYNEDGEINLLFHQINFYTYKLEQFMVLQYRDNCSVSFDYKLKRILSFFRDLITNSRPKTMHQYEKLLSWILRLAHQSSSSSPSFCNPFLHLECGDGSLCDCPKGLIHEGGACKLERNQSCLMSNVSWVPICRNDSICDGSRCVCNEGGGATCDEPDDCETENVQIGVDTFKKCKNVGGKAKEEEEEEKRRKQKEHIGKRLAEIEPNKVLPLDSLCDPESENQLKQMEIDLIDVNGLELKKFCGAYLSCDLGSRRCDCHPSSFIREGDECRLKEWRFCGEIGVSFPGAVPTCRKGTKCRRIGYRAHQCVPLPQSSAK